MVSPLNVSTALKIALTQTTGSAVHLTALRPMAGGASQESWQLDVTVAAGLWQGEHRLVLRWQPHSRIYDSALDLAQEFAVLEAAYAAGVPVPRPYWFLPDLQGRPALLMARAEGETIGRRIVTHPELAVARAALPEQMGRALAAIHAVDWRAYHLEEVVPGVPAGRTPAQARLDQLEAYLDGMDEAHPALELGLRWLRRNEPAAPKRLVLAHGDFRLGNVVVNQTGLVSVLDWEFAHLGDAAEDLAWPLVRAWRFGVDHLRFAGVGRVEAFWRGYEVAGGAPVDAARVFYWEVMGNLSWAVGTLNQARRHLSGRTPSLELASLGRKCAEMELEVLSLIEGGATGQGGAMALHHPALPLTR